MNRLTKILAAMLFASLALPLSAQHYVGVMGGYGFGTARFTPSREMGWESGMYSAGAVWKYYSPIAYVGGISAELKYADRGYKIIPNPNREEGLNLIDSTYVRRISSIELPFIWQPHVYVFNKRVRIFLNLGVYIAYHMSSTEKKINHEGIVEYDRDYDLRIVRDNIWGYGLLGGGGFGVLIRRFEVYAEARYTFGYSDILKNVTKYPDNRVVRTPMDGFNIYLGVTYRLGKKGILSPQGVKKSDMPIFDDL